MHGSAVNPQILQHRLAIVGGNILCSSRRSQVELQKLEKKLADAMDALKVEHLSSEKASRRAALEQHRLEQVPIIISKCIQAAPLQPLRP